MRFLPVLLLVVLVLPLLACSGLRSMGPAERGDVRQMRAALAEDLRQGRLTRGAVTDLAATVAERELLTAKGPAAVQRVQQARACARHLEDPLLERVDAGDRAAPHAAMALLMVGLGSPGSWRDHVSSQDPDWRAVAVRTLTDRDDGRLRRERMLDPDENVRLAAVRASEDAVDVKDRGVLLDRARLDPFRLARVRAIRAVAGVGDADVVLRLKDMWPTASSPVRQAIVAAWAWPGMLEQGGQRELIWAAESSDGTPSIIAGGVLMRLGAATRGIGVAALIKGIQDGLARDRALAITMAPIDDPTVRELIKKASEDGAPKVKIAALGRLVREPKERKEALNALGTLASSDKHGKIEARHAMALAGDTRVTRLLLQDGKNKKPEERLQAARSLLALDDAARAVFFLADPDVDVRTQIACEILLASERW